METGADRQLIAAYLDGEEGAAREVEAWIRREIEICYPGLRAEMDDLCQVVHRKLLESLRADRFRHRSALKTYVGRIAHHTAIDLIRRRRREQAATADWLLDAAGGAATPHDDVASLEEQVLVDQILLHAPEHCRELWRLVFVERLSYNEIGRRLSLPPGTVKSRMWHCRRKALALLRMLQRGGAGPSGGGSGGGGPDVR